MDRSELADRNEVDPPLEINRSLTGRGGLAPAGQATLRRVPKELWRHAEHRVLMPLTAYARALDRIQTAWSEVWAPLQTLEGQVRFGLQPDAHRDVERTYTALLHALNEHLDACYLVMRCAAPMPPKMEGVFSDKVARKQRLPRLSTFEEQVINSYRRPRLGAAVNAIKHASARMRFVFGESNGDVVLGYFIDGPLPSGAIGPALRVHPDGNSAFSFNRDMLMHFWWMHRASELMADVIKASLLLDPESPVERGDDAKDSWTELCSRIARVPSFFLPDESSSPYPLVIFDPLRNALRMRFPAGRSSLRGSETLRLTALLTIDEVGQAYKVPYMGRDEVTIEGQG